MSAFSQFRQDDRGRLHLGYFSRNTEGRFTIDFQADDTAGVGLDIAASPSGKAFSKFGNYYIGQDASGNMVVQNSAGTEVARLAASGAAARYNPTPVLVSAPVVIAPTGTMANNGAITLGTALPLQYPGAYIYLPASAIAAGSAAGLYWSTWSSTTVGTVYNNTWDGASDPTPPSSPVAFVTTGPGAFTGPSAEAAYLSFPLDAAQPDSVYDITLETNQTNNATAKTVKYHLTNLAGALIDTKTLTSLAFIRGRTKIANQELADKQLIYSETVSAAAIAKVAPALGTLTLSSAWTLAVTVTKGATDVVVISFFRVVRYDQ